MAGSSEHRPSWAIPEEEALDYVQTTLQRGHEGMGEAAEGGRSTAGSCRSSSNSYWEDEQYSTIPNPDFALSGASSSWAPLTFFSPSLARARPGGFSLPCLWSYSGFGEEFNPLVKDEGPQCQLFLSVALFWLMQSSGKMLWGGTKSRLWSQKKAYVQRQLHTAKFNTEEKLDNDISMSSDGQEQKVSRMNQANRKQSCCFTHGTSWPCFYPVQSTVALCQPEGWKHQEHKSQLPKPGWAQRWGPAKSFGWVTHSVGGSCMPHPNPCPSSLLGGCFLLLPQPLTVSSAFYLRN